MKNEFRRAPLQADASFGELGVLIDRLQVARHAADYAPRLGQPYEKGIAMARLRDALRVVQIIRDLDDEQALTLATCLLFRERRS